jgi:hypothetical protein
MQKSTILVLVVGLAACAPQHRVVKLSPDTYRISESGGWGYDLNELKREVQSQAQTFARAAGKDYELVSETTDPVTSVGVYPADNDTYTLVFRLTEPSH